MSVIGAVCINRYVAAVYFAVIIALGLWEFITISRPRGIKMNPIFIYFTSLFVYLAVFLQSCGEKDNAMLFLILSFLSFISLLISSLYIKKTPKPFTITAYSLTAILYITLPLSFANLLFAMNDKLGFNVLLSVFIFAWCNDTFAYLIGSRLGQNPLFKRHSPKKSWEGFIGGVLMTIVAGVVMYFIFDGKFYVWVLMALVTSVVGTFGDLFESMLKRQMGVKDSGNILPGHGGILDRFDILLFVLPAIWVVLKLVEFIGA